MNRKAKEQLKAWGAAAALASIPLTVMAAGISDSELSIVEYGLFGQTSNSSTSGVAVAIGTNIDWSGTPTLAVGSDLNSYDANSLVVGHWNKNSQSDELFVVGKGSSGAEENAFVINAAGEVKAPVAQGDVPMGIFAN